MQVNITKWHKEIFLMLGITLLFSCSKNGGGNTAPGNGSEPDKPAYVTDLSASYSSPSATGWAKALRRQQDGKILVLGHQWLVRLASDGVTVDNTFKPITDIASSALVNGIELQEDGKVIVFGKFSLANGKKGIVRLNTDGSLDNTFNNPVLDISYQAQAIDIRAVKVLPAGKMIIAGAFSYKTPASFGWGIARLNADQTLDHSFISPIAAGDTYNVRCMLALSGGEFLLTGYGAIKLKDGLAYTMVKINKDGVADNSFVFDKNGTRNVTTLIGLDMKELPGGKIIVSWYDNVVQPFSHVAVLNANGSLDAGFQVFETGGLANALCVLPDQHIWIGIQPDGNQPYEKRYLCYLDIKGKEDVNSRISLSSGSSVFSIIPAGENVLAGGNLNINNNKYAVLRLKKNQ